MARYILSKGAQKDVVGISDYTIENLGIKQAQKYRDGLVYVLKTYLKAPKGEGFTCSTMINC